MARSEAAVLVDAPADAIFPWLVEGERLRRWVSGLLVHEQLSPVRFRQVVQEGAARASSRAAPARSSRGARSGAWRAICIG